MGARRSSPHRPGGRIRASVMLVVAIALGATACVGSVDRAEFERMVQERGGGLSQTLVIDAVAALEDELGADQVLIESIVATSETVTIIAVNPEFTDELDRYTYRGGGLSGPDPVNQGSTDLSIPAITLPDLPPGVTVPQSVQDLLDQAAGTEGAADPEGLYRADDVSLDQLDRMVDEALETAGLRSGYADSLSVDINLGARPEVRVNVTNDRRSVRVVFGPRGRLLEVA